MDTTVGVGRIDASRPRTRRWGLGAAGLATALVVGVAYGGVPPVSAATVVALLPAALVDVRSQRLPDPLVALAAIVLCAGLALAAATGSAVEIGTVAGGAALLAGPLLALHLIEPASMGFGDVKAGLVLGAAVGVEAWHLSLAALAVAAALTALAALVLRTRTVPLGPGLVAGAVAALLFAPVLVPAGSVATQSDAAPLPVAHTVADGARR